MFINDAYNRTRVFRQAGCYWVKEADVELLGGLAGAKPEGPVFFEQAEAHGERDVDDHEVLDIGVLIVFVFFLVWPIQVLLRVGKVELDVIHDVYFEAVVGSEDDEAFTLSEGLLPLPGFSSYEVQGLLVLEKKIRQGLLAPLG